MIAIKPISISKSILYFIISSMLIYFGLYKGIPFLLSLGYPFIIGYMIFFYVPLVLLFVTALILYRQEGNKWNWFDFKNRLRLKKLSKTDWLWALGLLIFGLITYLGLSPIGNWLAKFA
jgi:hypothetical protein